MKLYYDLHIHSDLSPCADKEMTPNNIINMAYIKGLNIISVTDHNTTGNIQVIMQLGNKLGIEVIPGIEVTTREEVHVLCYFNNLSAAEEFGYLVYESLPDIKNNSLIFGEQNIYNCKDEIIGQLDKLLLNASKYTLDEVFRLTKRYKGIMVPAHINKKSNSILGILGFMPLNLKIDFIEIFQKNDVDEEQIKKYYILRNSDAHKLTDISEPVNSFELDTITALYEFLKL